MKIYKATNKRRFKEPELPKPLIKPFPNWNDGNGRRKASEELNREYGECRQLEKKLAKVYRLPSILSLEESRAFCKQICIELGILRYPHIHHLQSGCFGMVAGYCSGKDIVIQTRQIYTSTLLHEMGHYVVYRERLNPVRNFSRSHSGDYLWVLEAIYEIFNNLERRNIE